MYGHAQQQPKLVMDFDEWVQNATPDELREALRWQKASAAMMQIRLVRTLDGCRELRTLLRHVIEHPVGQGHPLQGEIQATLEKTSALMRQGEVRATSKDQAVGA